MPFFDLVARVQETYGPVLLLRRLYPREQRLVVEHALTIATMVLFALVLLAFAVKASPVGSLPALSVFTYLSNKIYGLFLIVFSVKFLMSALEAFHRSYYFRGLNQVLAEDLPEKPAGVSFEVATIVDATNDMDVTRAFLDSAYGQETLFRLGVDSDAFTKYFVVRIPFLQGSAFVVERDHGVTLAAYARSLYKQDTEFRTWLQSRNINEADFTAAAAWVMQIEHSKRLTERWWARDNLGRVPGLGKTWSYGESFLLEKYGHEMTEDPVWQTAVQTVRDEDDEVEALETILARGRQSNALLVGAEGSGTRERVAQLYHKIREGIALPQIEDKRVFFTDIGAIVQATGEKGAFENELKRVVNEAVHAGNIILYVEYIPAAIASATVLGTDLIDVLTPYFESNSIQIVASTDEDGLSRHLARDSRFMQYFDIVRMTDMDQSSVLGILEQRALALENKTGIAFTLPALHKVVQTADQYFPDGVMPDKALDLLEELVPMAEQHHRATIDVADVDEVVTRKTGVPLGTPDAAERTKLLGLEDFLHKRVVGQEGAVGGVARALRRARAGVGATDKPMGSFLFLGPTGVGKTETAKALAEALFQNEDAMIRLDMSEYQGADALDRLIGSFDTGEPGRLSTLLREKQYGVLLLDEFEKSDRNIHDLFLQILDEGQFTDSAGKRVNARNLIIIATSNAGSDLIWNWAKEGKDIQAQKSRLIDELINRALFRPEFLNRFDDIVLFHPLDETHIGSIARIQLELLAKRLETKGVRLAVTDELVAAVAKEGYDPQFGGRPMKRAIKDKVEQAVADRMLAGTLKQGEKLVLRAEDLA